MSQGRLGENHGSSSLLDHSYGWQKRCWGGSQITPPGLGRKMVPWFPPWVTAAGVKTRLSSR